MTTADDPLESLDSITQAITPCPLEVPDIGCSSSAVRDFSDLFAEKKRKKWNADGLMPRCDFAERKISLFSRNPDFFVIARWKRSLYGRTLDEIKHDDDMIPFFAREMNSLIRKTLGNNLSSGDWCLVTAPRRRHLNRNFATLVCEALAPLLGIQFLPDIALCDSRQRVNASFHLAGTPPEHNNIIIFDDIVTTGSTMIAMNNLLSKLGKNIIFFTAINNKL